MPATKASPKKPAPRAPDLAARRATLHRALASQGLDAILVTNFNDVGYLSGFHGGDSYALLGPAIPRPVIISDFRYQEELAPLDRDWEVVIRTGPMTDAVIARLAEARSETVGVQAESMTVGLMESLRSGCQKAGARTRFQATSGLLAAQRAVKDKHEVALIRRAIAIQEAALGETLRWLGRGLSKGPVSEVEIAGHLEWGMKSGGSPKPGFETIIAARANGSHPHYRPGPAKLSRNQALLVDWGATYAGYHGDMTRVFCWGKWPAKLARVYAIVLEAHEAAAAALKPGVSTREIDGIARGVITDAGFGEHFGHGLGHGIGLDGHEEPRLSHMAAGTALQPGHVVTIEPGIYLPGVGGIRIEDDYLITPGGAENLCSMPKDLAWATR